MSFTAYLLYLHVSVILCMSCTYVGVVSVPFPCLCSDANVPHHTRNMDQAVEETHEVGQYAPEY